MSTKEKILTTALVLFNKKGVEKVTTRQIAIALGMSQGNLCYHFPKKEDIVHALYEQLVHHFDTLYASLSVTQSSSKEKSPSPKEMMAAFLSIINTTNQYFIDYKFLMLNFVQIMRWYPTIKEHYQTLTIQRNQQLLLSFQIYEQVGLMKKEAYEGQHNQMLEQFMILNNFWLSHSEVLYPNTDAKKSIYFNQVVSSYLFPYLTERGQQLYLELITSKN